MHLPSSEDPIEPNSTAFVTVTAAMPQGTPYNAFIPPYPIRVDDFSSPSPSTSTSSKDTQARNVGLYLLTHTHTDHLNGLAAKSFGQTIECSHDAKEMLLRYEVYAERTLRDMDLRAQNVRTFAHLKVDPQRLEDGGVDNVGSRDQLVSPRFASRQKKSAMAPLCLNLHIPHEM